MATQAMMMPSNITRHKSLRARTVLTVERIIAIIRAACGFCAVEASEPPSDCRVIPHTRICVLVVVVYFKYVLMSSTDKRRTPAVVGAHNSIGFAHADADAIASLSNAFA